MEIEQLKEQIPHWTQRIGSGTCAEASAWRREVSRWNKP
jgi:hypothetical protein